MTELGSSPNVRFLDPECVTVRDLDGNVLLCKCGKPAGMGLIGKEAHAYYCQDCAPLPKRNAGFVYRPPKVKDE